MRAERAELIREIERRRGSRLICYIVSDRQNALAIIANDALPFFYNHLRAIGQVPKLDVMIYAAGGLTLAAFGLARLLREFSKWVGVLVPHRCFSAGTLFALGANEICMTQAGTLSPIDPSITTPLNPIAEPFPGQKQPQPVSVESVAAFKSLLEKDWGVKKEELLSDIFKILADRVHPLALGDVYRSRQQIERLADSLLKQHRTDQMRIKKIRETLTRELGSHDYPISRSEARKLMGNQIAPDDSELEDLVWRLYEDFSKELELGIPYNPAAIINKQRAEGRPLPVRVSLVMALIESLGRQDTFRQEMLVSEVIAMGPAGQIKAVQQEVIQAGWNVGN